MKKILFFVMCSTVLFITGCSVSKQSDFDAYSANSYVYTPNDFVALLKKQFGCNSQAEFAEAHPNIFWGFDSLSLPNAKIDDFADITPDEVRGEIGCQIFKNKTVPVTFVLYHDTAYPIAAPMYGSGIIDIKTCDFDNNGQIDIIYSASVSGSGRYFPQILHFNFSDLKEVQIYSSSKFEDYTLKKENNQYFTVYTIDVSKINELDGFIHNQSKIAADKKIGVIVSENNAPVGVVFKPAE